MFGSPIMCNKKLGKKGFACIMNEKGTQKGVGSNEKLASQ